MPRVYEETKEKIRIIKKLLFEGKTLSEIQMYFESNGLVIRNVADFIKERPEEFKGIKFMRRVER